MECALGVSTVGKRQLNDDDCNDGNGVGESSFEQITAQVLEKLELESPFFDQNPARLLPSFTPEGTLLAV